MKKNSLSVFSLAVILCLQTLVSTVKAENVTPQKAKKVATYYLSIVKDDKSVADADAQLVYQVMNPSLNVAAAYVFNVGEQGYVVVAGSDCTNPIIGYSEYGHINPTNMPPAMKVWLEQFCEPIIEVQNMGYYAPDYTLNKWKSLLNRTLSPEPQSKDFIQLVYDKWGQGDPYSPTYNAMCPADGQGNRAIVGCVATAVSMILHYWEFPRKGRSSIFFPGSMADINVNFAKAYYDYEAMPNELTTASNQEAIDATALLCYHVGAAVKMNYGLDASGTVSEEVVTALPKYFKYQTPSTARRSNYTTQRWIDTLTNEIQSGRPVYYAARDLGGSGRDAGGHAFLCTGLRNGKFYINWGWDGGSNGWYDMEATATAFWAGSYNFKDDQRLIFRITPPQDSIVGINSVKNFELAEAYPNPTFSQIAIPYKVEKPTLLQICNVNGRIVRTVVLRPNEESVTLDVSGYSKGIYFYRANGVSHRFIVY